MICLFLLRIVYFLLVGWWAGILWSGLAYLLCLTIVGLPVGLMMFNRLPQVLTLKPVSDTQVLYISNSGSMVVRKDEFPFIIRALYFFFLGWHLTGAWVGIALILCLTIIGMPLGLMMLNHVPLVLTLKRRY